MKYKIKCNGQVIAAFVFEADRNECLDALQQLHDDYVFETLND